MAPKRKFAGEAQSQALVPMKKQKQHQISLLNQGGAVQTVCIDVTGFLVSFPLPMLVGTCRMSPVMITYFETFEETYFIPNIFIVMYC